jgi:soluble lytic murein transglycosylase
MASGIVAAAVACASGFRPPAVPRVETPAVAAAAIARTDGARSPGQTLMLEGLFALRDGRGRDAIPLFERATVEYPALGDYHLYYLGLANASVGDAPAARASFERLQTEFPDSVLAPLAALHGGRLAAPVDSAPALASLDRARAALSVGSPDWVKATLLLAGLDARQGDPRRARRMLQEIRSRVGPGVARRRAQREERRLLAAHPEIDQSADAIEVLDEARLLLREGVPGEAEGLLRRALEGGAPASARPRLSEALAHAQRAQGNVGAAETTLETVIRKYPEHAAAADAMMTVATWRWNRDDDAGALAGFSAFGRRHPGHARAADARYAIGRIHQTAGRFDAARAAYGELARRHPDAKVAPEARWRGSWLLYVQGRHARAATAFGGLAETDGSPWVRESARYWQARAVERAHGAPAAQALYAQVVAEFPRGYYALWAERWLADRGMSSVAAPPPAGAVLVMTTDPMGPLRDADPTAFSRPLDALARDPDAALLDPARFRRAAELETLGLRRLAVGELDAIPFPPSAEKAARLVLLEAYTRVGRHDRALVIPGLMQSRSLAPLGGDVDRFLFPRGYWTQVKTHAARHGLDPYLVAALIRQESGYAPDAVSSVGARGLMQLMPATADRLARVAGTPAPALRDLEQPEINIAHGTAYMRELYGRYGPSLHKILAAYNAGEDAVAKWEGRFPDAPPDEFVEQISYRETRDFVKAVLRNYRAYRALYGAGPVPPAPVNAGGAPNGARHNAADPAPPTPASAERADPSPNGARYSAADPAPPAPASVERAGCIAERRKI